MRPTHSRTKHKTYRGMQQPSHPPISRRKRISAGDSCTITTLANMAKKS